MAAQVEVDLLMSDDDDDYVEIIPDTHSTPDGLILPSLSDSLRTFYNAPSRPSSGRIERRRPRRPVNSSQYEQLRRLANPRLYPAEAPQPPAQSDVIDLTEEPDSPVETRAPPPAAAAPSGGRNPRRTNSQRSSAPRLARSDSTFMAPPPPADVIDLTDDSPGDDYPRLFPGLRSAEPTRDQLLEFQIDHGRQVASFARGFGRRLAGILGTDVFRNAFLTPHLDVTRSATFPQRQPSPKPPMEPIPAAREGFTRDTRAEPEEGDTTVVVCPACQEELAYDPAGGATGTVGSTGKKKRRAPGEHHFWAVKKCGHVYCADCFENRRPTKNSTGAGFPTPANGAATDIHCAVEGCETKVSQKAEWVGIFL